jgi:DNA invertase Pin-like site-specific DNA recombinase
MRMIGYARVSTDGQSVEAQCAALRASGCAVVVAEKVSGAVTTGASRKRSLSAALTTSWWSPKSTGWLGRCAIC